MKLRPLHAVLCLISFAGCYQQNSYQEPPPPNVPVASPLQESVTSYVEQTGTAQASERVELRPRVSGFLVERNFEDGNLVKAGQLLFVIDEEPFQVRLTYARAKLSEAESTLRKAMQSKAREIAQAQLNLNESEYELARINHERNIGLLGQNALSRQEYDRSEAAQRTSSARIQASRAELEQATVDYDTNILSAQAALALAKSEVRTAEIDLGYCRITAPIDGVIGRRAFDVGNYVTADSSNILASIVRVDPIYAYASISEDDLVLLKTRYQSAEGKSIPILMGIGEDRTYPFSGTIDYISPIVQADTGTVQIRGVFPNTGIVMPGMFIRVRIPSEENPNAILVSERSIGFDQAGAFLYAVDGEGTIVRRSVTAGQSIQGKRVVSGEVTLEDQIVADGLLKVRPGMKVTPVRPGEKKEGAAEEPAPSAEQAATH